jgi:hypothetical protein
MKVIELLEFSREILIKLKNAGVRLDDCKFIDMYHEYTTMRKSGEKVTYIVPVLAIKYNISERKAYYIIRRFGTDCLQRD